MDPGTHLTLIINKIQSKKFPELDIENNKLIQIEYHLKHHVLKTFISLIKCSTSYTTGGFPKKTRTKQQRAAANKAVEQL